MTNSKTESNAESTPASGKSSEWKRMSFKGNKVWAAINDTGEFDIQKGHVLIKYNLKQDYEYRVKPESLESEEAAVPSKKKTPSKKKGRGLKTPEFDADKGSQIRNLNLDIPDNCIKIFTDGASSGNPGPAGIGVLLIYREKKKEISQYIGKATNNIAELTAIKVALEELKRKDLPVRIFSDSSYSIGLLTKGWKPKKNQELAFDIRELMKKFKDLEFIKVKGHAGIKENEVADYLATSAVKKGQA